jgi:hypothetical protein
VPTPKPPGICTAQERSDATPIDGHTITSH